MELLSIIIPTLNEEENLPELLDFFKSETEGYPTEIIVADGGSDDKTLAIASEHGAQGIECHEKGRAAQMNEGASRSRGEILYFVHADTLPPCGFVKDIFSYFEKGYDLGCYRSSFLSDDPRMKVNAWFTRFDLPWCRGGDQTLFISRGHFEKIGGFDQSLRIMEDFDLLERARKNGKFIIMPRCARISARKYHENSYFRVNLANLVVFCQYKLGASQEKMINTYNNMLAIERYGLKN